MFDTYGVYIEKLKKKDGETLLSEYEELSEDTPEWKIECYKRAIIEKYAKEIGFR